MSFPYSPFADDGERAALQAKVNTLCVDLEDLSKAIQDHDTMDWRDKNRILGPFVAMTGWCKDTKLNIEKVVLEQE